MMDGIRFLEQYIMKNIHVIGGGTFSHVRNHLALAAPAFGSSAKKITQLLLNSWAAAETELNVYMHLTKMADSNSNLVTNDDVSALLDKLIADPDTRVIVLNAALCDFDGAILIDGQPDPTLSGSHATRLKTANGECQMRLTPTNKLIGKIRKDRKDIFVVGFKTTTNASSDEQYRIALDMLKRDSLNLVLANDTVTRNNMIVAPEETRYFETTDRDAVLEGLVKILLSRSQNTFTRSTVVDGPSISWNSNEVPANLRKVVDHCIERGAYKPFRGVTAGHFAVKVDDHTIFTSKRKHNFNQLRDMTCS